MWCCTCTPDSNGLQVIVGDLEIKGTSDFKINYREYVTSDIPQAWLVEMTRQNDAQLAIEPSLSG